MGPSKIRPHSLDDLTSVNLTSRIRRDCMTDSILQFWLHEEFGAVCAFMKAIFFRQLLVMFFMLKGKYRDGKKSLSLVA